MDSLVYLVKAVILAANKPTERENLEFYVEILTQIALLNQDRIISLWLVG